MNEQELKLAYEARKPILKKYGEYVLATIFDELKIRLGSLAKADKFLQIPPTPRVKETDSFLEKALVRKKKSIPLTEITDQVGVRFVVLLLKDISLIGEIINSIDSWSSSKDRDYEQERLEKPDYFAYQSDHYVVTNKNSFDYHEINIPAGVSCEIQIRTILQHAYAEMAHQSDYKPSIKLPAEEQKQIKRSLAKGSALIETADDVFKEIQNYFASYDSHTIALLTKASELYQRMCGEIASPESRLNIVITDTYREQLKNLTTDVLDVWVNKNQELITAIIKAHRDDSVFYRDSFIIILGWLVTNHRISVPKSWPIDNQYLEDFYTHMGVSTDGVF